jgi:hypothetical protein
MSYKILRCCWCDIVLNVHAPAEDEIDRKGTFCEELERVFDKFLKCHMKILLGDFSAKDVFKPTMGNDSYMKLEISSDNGVTVVNFATFKNLIIRSTTFPYYNIHKFNWPSPDGKTRNHIGHILIDRRHSSVLDV